MSSGTPHAESPWERQKFEASLVNAYREQQGEEPVEPAAVRPILEDCTLKIAQLLATPETAAELSPTTKRLHGQLKGGRPEHVPHFEERLAILFNPNLTVHDVAARQGVKAQLVRQTLRNVFRRLAVVEGLLPSEVPSPESLKRVQQRGVLSGLGRAVMDIRVIEPAPVSSIREQVGAILSGLNARDQAILDLFYGITSGTPKSYTYVARVHGVTQSGARKAVQAALRRLSTSDSYEDIRTFFEAQSAEAAS